MRKPLRKAPSWPSQAQGHPERALALDSRTLAGGQPGTQWKRLLLQSEVLSIASDGRLQIAAEDIELKIVF